MQRKYIALRWNSDDAVTKLSERLNSNFASFAWVSDAGVEVTRLCRDVTEEHIRVDVTCSKCFISLSTPRERIFEILSVEYEAYTSTGSHLYFTSKFLNIYTLIFMSLYYFFLNPQICHEFIINKANLFKRSFCILMSLAFRLRYEIKKKFDLCLLTWNRTNSFLR